MAALRMMTHAPLQGRLNHHSQSWCLSVSSSVKEPPLPSPRFEDCGFLLERRCFNPGTLGGGQGLAMVVGVSTSGRGYLLGNPTKEN